MLKAGSCWLVALVVGLWLTVPALATADAQPAPCECQAEETEDEPLLPMMVSLPIIVLLVAMSGLFSGLTLGLMGLDLNGLLIVQKSDKKDLALAAKKIAPVREKGNQLLCTLLLGNVAVNSALSILTAEIANGLVGFFVSTALIVIFGEILPQAACSRYALQIGARTVPLVKVLMVLFWLLTKPISLMLDWMLGQEMGTVHSHTELLEMLKLQVRLGATDEATGAIAKQVVEGALSFRDKQAEKVMTPLEDSFMLHYETRLGYKTIREIFETGFSRIPVFGRDKNDYKGLLYTKDLMLADPEDEMRVGDFISIFNRKVESFFRNTKLVDVLNSFKKGGTHMGLVRETNLSDPASPRVEICGILTLEDVMEEILQEEIVDETDVYVDVDRHVRVHDGREARTLNLGVFNPIWACRHGEGRLAEEEVDAIGAHLLRSTFASGTELALSANATRWLVILAKVENQERQTPPGSNMPHKADCLYTKGETADKCILVLQGRIGIKAGREEFRCDAGAFTVLGKDALRPGRAFVSDFTAYLLTPKARLLVITKAQFMEAVALEAKGEIQSSLSALAAEISGEVTRRDMMRGGTRLMGSSASDLLAQTRYAVSAPDLMTQSTQLTRTRPQLNDALLALGPPPLPL